MEACIIVICLILDQVTKYWVQTAKPMDVGVISRFFYLTYVKNTGAAWSMLSGQQVLLSVIAAAAIGAMLYFLLRDIRSSAPKMMRISLSLMIAGAAGNLIDRLFLNYVRDFLHFYPFGYDFPVFNVADMCLTIGVCLLILQTLLEDRKDGKGETHEQN